MLDLSPLGYAASRIEERHADIFMGQGSFADTTPPTLYSLGAVRNVTAEGTARTTSPDSHGRTYQRGVDLVVSWEVMQTDYAVEFATLPTLIGAEDLLLKVTDVAVSAAEGATLSETQANLSTAAHAAAGIEFENITIEQDFALNYDGDDNIFTLRSNMRLSNAQIRQIGNSPIVF